MKGNKLSESAATAKAQPPEDIFDPTARPIWEIADEISASVPPEEWSKVPTDGSINFRHYRYGHPKKKE